MGNLIFIHAHILLSSKGSATGVAAMSIPFSVAATKIMDGALVTANITFDAGNTYPHSTFAVGTSLCQLREGGSGVGSTQLSDTNFVNTSEFDVWGFYWTITAP
jgi:hypothetical protein